VTHSIGDQGLGEAQPGGGEHGAAEGPDPVFGAGLALLGIFVMGTGGARDAHYVFDAGVVTAVLGAGVFVLSVALSAMKQRKSQKDDAGQG